MTAQTLASRFKRSPEKSVTEVLDALTELGMVAKSPDVSIRLSQN